MLGEEKGCGKLNGEDSVSANHRDQVELLTFAVREDDAHSTCPPALISRPADAALGCA